jgi:hypothetical protein
VREFAVTLRFAFRRYIADVAAQEWPLMAQGTANLRAIPGVLAEALQATVAYPSSGRSERLMRVTISSQFRFTACG